MLQNRIRYHIARLIRRLQFGVGFGPHLLRDRNGSEILVFHGISRRNELSINSRFISERNFESFLDQIKRFNIISLEDFYAGRFKHGQFNLTLTFDDGYLNNYRYVVPLLERYNFPATFFITPIHQLQSFLWPDFVDLAAHFSNKSGIVFQGEKFDRKRGREFWSAKGSLKSICKQSSFGDIRRLQESFQSEMQLILSDKHSDYWKLMDAQQIKYLADHPLFTVGAHGLTHTSLPNISVAEAKSEISESKRLLEGICEREIDAFAFPFGDYNETLTEYCISIGLRKILMVDYDQKSVEPSTTVRERFVTNPHISVKEQIACFLKGSYY